MIRKPFNSFYNQSTHASINYLKNHEDKREINDLIKMLFNYLSVDVIAVVTTTFNSREILAQWVKTCLNKIK